jgi:hypothetical protein
VAVDAASILRSPRLAVTLEALARSYDHVVINAGALQDDLAEAVAGLAPQAVLVADAPDDPATASMQARLVAAGCSAVSVLPSLPAPDGTSARAAA